MSPAEIHGRLATAGKPASRETKKPLADAATPVVAVMPKGVEVEGIEVAAGIEAAEKREIEEFQCRRIK
jgi:hypothetical protein